MGKNYELKRKYVGIDNSGQSSIDRSAMMKHT